MLIHPNQLLRTLATDTLGRLARVVTDTSFVYDIIDSLINQVVENREPDSRAGASLALGCINSYVGGMVAGPRLRKVVGVLHSLANDPHPLVHKWVTRTSFFEFIIFIRPFMHYG